MTGLNAALYKEARLHWRSRGQIFGYLLFGAAALFLFSFAVGPDSEALRRHASGFLWLALLLASTLTLAESFAAEVEHRAQEGLLLVPADPRALFYGKAIANAAVLMLLGLLLYPLTIALYDAPIAGWELVAVIVLGAAGLAAPGTLYAAMTAENRARQTLMPLLLFPLVVPVLLAAVKATSLALYGDPMRQIVSWGTLLVSFDAIYWSLCGIFYELVVEPTRPGRRS